MRQFCVFILLTLVGQQARNASGDVNCFVCSWQDREVTVNGTSGNDTCTLNNFDAEVAGLVQCSIGCEMVSFANSENEESSHVYRNCLTKERKMMGPINDTTKRSVICYNEQYKTHFIRRCECYSDFCNTGIRQSGEDMLDNLVKVLVGLVACVVKNIFFQSM